MQNARETVDAWLAQTDFGTAEPPRLNEDGRCMVVGEGDNYAVVEVPEGANFVLVYAPLGEPPENEDGAVGLLVSAMTANLLMYQTEGGAIGFEPENRVLILSFREDIAWSGPERLHDVIAFCIEKSIDLKYDLFGQEPRGPAGDIWPAIRA